MTNYLFDEIRTPSLHRNAEIFAITDDCEVSFGALFGGALRIAAVLRDAGVEPGDRVAAQVSKSITALQLYIGCVAAGGVFLPLNTAYTDEEVTYFVNDAAPRVLVCDPARADGMAQIAPGGLVLTLGADGTGNLTQRAEHAAALDAPVARAESDLAAILYTSGTTGRPKGAMLSHLALASNSKTLAELWRFSSEDVLIHALPIFHTHGLFVATNVALVSGARIIFHAGFDADAIIAAMPQATALMGVPTFYTRLLAHPDLAAASTNMRLFVSGSAPLLTATHDAWSAKTGHAILERYGMTETNMNTSNPYDGDRRPGTVGFPLPGVELKICDPDTGAQLSRGEVGSIEVRGPNLFSGYWQMPDKTAEDMRDDGFFITGDLGVIDDDGYVSIVGRSKDLVISGGYNVYPKEIESLIDKIDGVSESAVIGLPHPDFGEAVAAIIVASAPDLDAAKISEALAGKLARYKQPKVVFFQDNLPRNTMGKVQKNLLRDAYQSTFKS